MHRDPRNPDPNYMATSGTANPVHAKLRKTLNLLCLADVYFVVEGLCEWPVTLEEMHHQARYYYEEHTCPTNFIRIPLIAFDGSTDPHGVFDFVDAVWMMDEYEAYEGDVEEYLCEVFPELKESAARLPAAETGRGAGEAG